MHGTWLGPEFVGGHQVLPGLTVLPRSSRWHGEIVVIESLNCTCLTISANTGNHHDIITLISVRSPRWVCSTSIMMMWAAYPQTRLHNQALHTHYAPGLSIGTDLVSFLICVLCVYGSNSEPWTCAGKEETMQLSTRTKIKTLKSRLHWMGTLSASVAAFLAGARSQPQPALVTTKHSRVFSQRGAAPWAAPDFGMLVESDVSRKSSGMVP